MCRRFLPPFAADAIVGAIGEIGQLAILYPLNTIKVAPTSTHLSVKFSTNLFNETKGLEHKDSNFNISISFLQGNVRYDLPEVERRLLIAISANLKVLYAAMPHLVLVQDR